MQNTQNPVQQPAQNQSKPNQAGQASAPQPNPTAQQAAQANNPMMQATGQSNQAQSNHKNNKARLLRLGGLVLTLLLGGSYYVYSQYLQTDSSSRKDLATQKGPESASQSGSQGTVAQNEAGKVVSGAKPAQQVSPTKLPEFSEKIKQPVTKKSMLIVKPAQNSYAAGEQVSFDVVLTGTEVPDGIEFILNYDPQLLGSLQLAQGNVFSSYLKKQVNQQEGKIQVVIIREPGQEISLTQENLLVTVTGTALKAGQLALTFDQDRTMAAANAGQDILESVQGATLQIN